MKTFEPEIKALHGIKTIDKYKTIAKILRRLIQVNLMKSRCRHESIKKIFMIFFYGNVTAFHQVALTACLVFCLATSRKMLRPTHPFCPF